MLGILLTSLNESKPLRDAAILDGIAAGDSAALEDLYRRTCAQVYGCNDDARTVIGDMDFSGADLTVTVNALIGSMLRHGYLNELANSILISVETDDADRGAALQANLSDEVSTILSTDAFTGSVISQTTAKDDELQAAADQYGSDRTAETTAASAYIGRDAALAAAYTHAGVSSGRDVECDLDGRMKYEIEFEANGYSHEYEIDACSGSVLKSEKDWDD